MKTIIARFQELKKNVGEIEVDGEIVDVNKIDTALKSVGVALRDDVTGQFRDLDDVFLELSQKWDTLDRNTQRYIATVAAGSRQQSRFLAMMDNYERTVELVNIANDSAGASSVQFDKTLGSIDSKINKIKASGEEIVGNLANNQFIKDTLDFVNKIMQTFAKISESGPIAMLAFAAVAYKVIKNIVNGGIDGIKLVAKEYDKLTKQIKTKTETTHEHTHIHKHIDTNGNLVDPVSGQPISTSQNSEAAKKSSQGKLDDTPQKTNKEISEGVQIASSIAKTLGSILSVVNLISTQSTSGMVGSTIGQGVGGAVGSLVNTLSMSGALGPWGMVVGPLIGPIAGFIGGAIGDAIDKSKGILSETYQKSLDKFKEELNQQKIDFDEENSGLLELAEEYDNLNSKTELTVEETQRLAEINKELAGQNKTIVSSRRSESGELKINSEALNEEIKLLKEKSLLLNNMSDISDFFQLVVDKETERKETNEKYDKDISVGQDKLRGFTNTEALKAFSDMVENPHLNQIASGAFSYFDSIKDPIERAEKYLAYFKTNIPKNQKESVIYTNITKRFEDIINSDTSELDKLKDEKTNYNEKVDLEIKEKSKNKR